MRPAYTSDEVRAAERPWLESLPAGALMERAAAGLATVALRELAERVGTVYGSQVVCLVGSGNNGGDALVAGARLARRGVRVEAVLLTDRPYAEGLASLLRAGGRVSTDADRALEDADLVLDGIVGIGGRGGLRPGAATLVNQIAPTAVVVAVDLPSGVDADTGEVAGAAVRADLTVTFGALKPGLLVDPGAGHCGRVELVDLALDLPPAAVELVEASDVTTGWPWPGRDGDKYARGVLGVVAGSDAYPGAAVLSVGGALRAGCGYVRVAAPTGVAGAVRTAWPEAVVAPLVGDDPPGSVGRVQAWLAGPGMGIDAAAATRLDRVLRAGLPTVVDADGLTLVATDPGLLDGRTPEQTLITPHAGELARLLQVERSEVERARLDSARRAADLLGVTVLLKGATTLVAAPGQPVRVTAVGVPDLGSAGTGDVLSGVCGALLAAGLKASDAGALAAFVHGCAGRTAAAAGPLVAGDVVAALPLALRSLRA